MKRISLVLLFFWLFFWGAECEALEKGAILYHTSADGIIYGKRDQLELPCSVLEATLGELKSGHTGLYVGNLRIIHALIDGIVETDSKNFISVDEQKEGVVYLGAKLPVNYNDPAEWSDERKEQLILIAKEQVGKGYDILFQRQTGPDSGDFTCVGLVEYVYEQVGYTITPMGYYSGGTGGKSHTQIYNCETTLWQDWDGLNTFAEEVRFSLFTHPLDSCCGREFEDRKYMFFPYTQFLQGTTVGVETDIPVTGETGSGGDSGGCFIKSIAP
ncbi:MAG: hypothetical protein R6X27_00305 [Candidatus Desulfacyla sp.]